MTNQEQIEQWNERSGPRWFERQAQLDSQLEALGNHALARLELRPGQRVLDVGCGCGASSLEIARRVAPSGAVVGLDVSRPMLGRARERAAAEQFSHLQFIEADAQVWKHSDTPFDAMFSRFGVMFFEAPETAFRNLHAQLRPGATIAFVCWQGIDQNPWIAIPQRAIVALLPEAPVPPQPGAPGPFALADPKRVTAILQQAGFQSVELEDYRCELRLGGTLTTTLEEAVALSLTVGPGGAIVREQPSLLEPAKAAVAKVLTPFLKGDGVFLPAACWVVSARA